MFIANNFAYYLFLFCVVMQFQFPKWPEAIPMVASNTCLQNGFRGQRIRTNTKHYLRGGERRGKGESWGGEGRSEARGEGRRWAGRSSRGRHCDPRITGSVAKEWMKDTINTYLPPSPRLMHSVHFIIFVTMTYVYSIVRYGHSEHLVIDTFGWSLSRSEH